MKREAGKVCEGMVCLECLHSSFALVNFNTAGEPNCKCKNCGRCYTPTGYRVAMRWARGEVECPSCGSVETKKNGRSKGKQRWHCKECDHGWIEGFQRQKSSARTPAVRVKRYYLRKNLGDFWLKVLEAAGGEEAAYEAAREIRKTAVAIAASRSGKSKTTEKDTARAFDLWRRGSRFTPAPPPDGGGRRRRYELRKKMGDFWGSIYKACGKNPEEAYEAARKIRSDAVSRAGGKAVGKKEMAEAFDAWLASVQ